MFLLILKERMCLRFKNTLVFFVNNSTILAISQPNLLFENSSKHSNGKHETQMFNV